MDGHDQDERRRIRRGRRRFYLLLAAVVLVGTAVAFVLGVALAGRGASVWEGDPPGWAENTGLVLAGTGLLTEIVALTWLIRNGAYRRNRDSRLWAVSWSRRRELVRQVRAGGPVPDGDLPLLRHTAEQMRGQVGSIWVQAGLVVLFAGQALRQFTWLWLGLTVLMAGLFAVAGWQMSRDARRGEEFLRTHPAAGQQVVAGP